ncbi:MAG: hypothetical protein SFW07_02690 [Gammaproteobacteria bacterium]|nr:hypothetical protein [Gammaproteobacteria bacterium]
MKNPKSLYNGRPDKNMKLLPREILGNFLLCVVVNFENKNNNITICSDPAGGDGILQDKKSGKTWETEHVMTKINGGEKQEAETLIIESIEAKKKKGIQYAANKRLIVFLEGGKKWFPNKLAKLIKPPLFFHSVWIFSLCKAPEKSFTYNIVQINNESLIWRVEINEGFSSWKVVRV